MFFRPQSVSAKQLAQTLGAPGVRLLDVRTPGEFEALRIAGAVNVPLDTLEPAALLASMAPDDPVYVVCQSCARRVFATSCTLTAAPTPGPWRDCPSRGVRSAPE